MKTFKAWEIIQSMNDRDRHLFRQCIGIDMMNREQYVTALYDLVISGGPEVPGNEVIFQRLYPGEVFNDGRVRYLKAQLFNLLKKFIFMQHPDMLFEDVAVFKYLREKKLLQLYRKEEQKLKSGGGQQEPDGTPAYLHRYFRALEWHHFNTKTNRIVTEHLEQMNLHIDLFFIVEKLKLACTAFNLGRLYKVVTVTSLLEPVLQYIEKQQLQERHKLLGIYYHAYQMLLSGEVQYYYLLTSHLLDGDRYYPVTEIKDAWLLAMNFCIQEINNGNTAFYKEAFGLYEAGIENLILLEDGYLNPITYSNAITIALRGKDFAGALQFAERFKTNLQGAEQEEYYFFNLSKYYFETGNFEKVIELYYQSNIRELLLHIQVRIIQIKAFYEKEELDICRHLNDNLQQLLSRKGILAYHKENYTNICKMFHQLLSLNQYDAHARQRFRHKTEGMSPLTEKVWFLEKAGG